MTPERRGPLPVTALQVGFVGAPEGMTQRQLFRVRVLLRSFGAVEVHFGGNPGADEQLYRLADDLRLWRKVHPLLCSAERSEVTGDVVYPPKQENERYHDVLTASGVLIAAPSSAQCRSGGRVWSVVADAVASGMPVVVVTPDGEARELGSRHGGH